MSVPAISVWGTAAEARSLAFTIYRCKTDVHPVEEKELPWSSVIELFRTHDKRDQKDGRGFSFVRLQPNSHRKNKNVVSLSAAVLDIDDGTPYEELRHLLGPYEYFAVSTHGHRSTKPKYRVILPFTHDVSVAEWSRVWKQVNALAGGHCDPATTDVSRFYYFPSCPTETASEAFFEHHPGKWLVPDTGFPEIPPHLVRREPLRLVLNEGALGGIELPPDESLQCHDGERTAHLVKLVGHWLSEDPELDAIIEKALLWNSTNLPPLHNEKVKRTCVSMWERYARKSIEKTDATSVIPAPTAQLLQPGSYVHPFAAPPVITRLFELSDATVEHFLAHEPPPRRYLLKDCLPLGKVGAIIAPGGTGKSQFVLQLAISVAGGISLAGGAWDIAEAGGVLALFAEDDTEELHRRFRNTVNSLREKVEAPNLSSLLTSRLFIRSMVAENNLMTYLEPMIKAISRTSYVERLILTAREIPDLKLIIIDPASRFRGGIENAAEDVTRFVEVLEHLSKETGATVLVVHHANKASMQGTEQTQSASRGSSAFSDGVRWQLNLSTMTKEEAKKYGVQEDQRYLYLSATMTKNNYAAPQPPVFLQRLDGGVLVKAALLDNEKREAQNVVLKVVEKIAASSERFSARSFEKSFGGTTNVFAIGVLALRGYVRQAIDSGYLVKDGDKRGLLSVTELGQAILPRPRKADSAMTG